MENTDLSNLFSINNCSPMMVFTLYVIVSAITLYMTRNSLKKFNTSRMDNLYNIYSWHEVKLVIFVGVILYGLCQYDKQDMAWIVLLFPLVYLILKNLMIFFQVSLAQQNVPKKKHIENEKVIQAERIKTESSLKKQQQLEEQYRQLQELHQQQQQEQQQQQVIKQQSPINKDIGGMSPPLNDGFGPYGGGGMGGGMGGMGGAMGSDIGSLSGSPF